MKFKEKEIKALWAESGNLCACPDCRNPLIVNGAVIGEMAHILGERLGAARYDPKANPATVNNPDNLLVLCPTCHTIIDKPELAAQYTVELLRNWKKNHSKRCSSVVLTQEILDKVVKHVSANDSGVNQVAINSPGTVQVARDLTINNFNRGPKFELLDVEGVTDGNDYFGQKAVLIFGAIPDGLLVNAEIRVSAEGQISKFIPAVRGTGILVNNPSIPASLDDRKNTFSWGQRVLQPASYMQVTLMGEGPLGRIRYELKSGSSC